MYIVQYIHLLKLSIYVRMLVELAYLLQKQHLVPSNILCNRHFQQSFVIRRRVSPTLLSSILSLPYCTVSPATGAAALQTLKHWHCSYGAFTTFPIETIVAAI